MDEAPKTSRTRPSATKHVEPRRHARGEELGSTDIRQTVAEVLRILLLRRWIFFVPFCLAATAAFLASHRLPRVYQASATFEQENDPVSVNLPPPLVTSTFSYFLSTLEQDIKSDAVLGPIVEDLGLAEDLPRDPDGTLTEQGRERRVGLGKSLAADVRVKAWRRSPYRTVVDLRYTGANPEVMVRLLEGMKEGYKRLVRRKVAEKLVDARDWYQERGDEQQEIIDEIDRKLTRLRMDHPGVDPANPDSIAYRLTSLQEQLAEQKRARSRLNSQIASRQEFLSRARTRPLPPQPEQPPPVPDWVSPQARRLLAAIDASEARIAELKLARGMTERHPDIVAERQLQERHRRALEMEHDAQAGVAEGPVEAPDALWAAPTDDAWLPAITQAETELQNLLDEQTWAGQETEKLEAEIADYVRMQGEIFDQRQEFSRIQEELERATDEHDTYIGLVAQCDRALTVENENRGILFTDVVEARGSVVPVSPLAKTVLTLSLLAGVAAGAGFVVLAELFDRRFRTATQVTKALGLPILEGIDEIVTSAERRKQFVRRAVVVPIASAVLLTLLGVSGGLSYLSLRHPARFERLMQTPIAAWAQLSQRLDEQTAEAPVADQAHVD